ncbi:hypothetical protein B0H11DRAFT_2204473 [Mycena galericulata]|nr:hypothetical protein B0H11DRAFT_2204473 [Mycena galericulata]
MPPYSITSYLLDRANIQDTITRMAWHLDRREWDKVASVFADDLIMDYSSVLGGQSVHTTPVAQAQVFKGRLDHMDATLTAPLGVLVELPQPLPKTAIEPPTEASASCSPLVILRRDAANEGPILQNGATWKFKLIKSTLDGTGNPWRISVMKADLLFMVGNTDVRRNPETGKGWA